MDNSRAGQCLAILKYLYEHGSITTLQARDELGIMSPASRVLELREQGHCIITHWTTSEDKTGTKHREAKYVLFNQDNKKAPSTSDQTNGKGFAKSINDNNRAGGIRQSSSEI
ncbi:MAG: helix-turn-helix domain-containing protein [Methylophaga sp.]